MANRSNNNNIIKTENITPGTFSATEKNNGKTKKLKSTRCNAEGPPFCPFSFQTKLKFMNFYKSIENVSIKELPPSAFIIFWKT